MIEGGNNNLRGEGSALVSRDNVPSRRLADAEDTAAWRTRKIACQDRQVENIWPTFFLLLLGFVHQGPGVGGRLG